MTRGADLQVVIREGRRFRTAHLDVRILASPLAFHRVGLIVPKHGSTAVQRNRLKRQLRELVRVRLLGALRSPGPASADVVVRARREAYAAPFGTLGSEIDAAASRVGQVHPRTAKSPDTGAAEAP